MHCALGSPWASRIYSCLAHCCCGELLLLLPAAAVLSRVRFYQSDVWELYQGD
jgi:hypothetical protein